MEQAAVVLHKRLKHIGYQAGHQKRQQHILKQMNQKQQGKYHHHSYDQAHHAVKCEFLSFGHYLSFFCTKLRKIFFSPNFLAKSIEYHSSISFIKAKKVVNIFTTKL